MAPMYAGLRSQRHTQAGVEARGSYDLQMAVNKGMKISFPPRRVLGPVDPGGLPPQLADVQARLDRAARRIEEMHGEIVEWWRHNEIRLVHQNNPALTEHWWVVEIPPAPLLDWSLDTGDIFHGLRSALDHSVYAAAQFVTGLDEPPRPRDLTFPIATTPAKFESQAKKSLRVFRDAGREDIIATIEDLQPYHDGTGLILDEKRAEGDGLGLLRDLNDVEKHRRPHEVSFSAPRSSPIFTTSVAKTLTHTMLVVGLVTNGQEVGRVTLSGPDLPTMRFDDPFVICALRLPLDAASMLSALHGITTEALHALGRTVWP